MTSSPLSTINLKTNHIWPEEPKLVDGEWVCSALLECGDGERKPIEYRLPEEFGHAISDRHDHFLLVSMFSAMKAGGACHLHGQVTQSLLVNLSEFTAIWSVWRPTDYNQLELTADSALPGRALGKENCLLAFSGGVDASATLLRHAGRTIGIRSRPIGGCLMLHGMDIPLGSEEAFATAKRSAQAITNSLNVPLLTMKTNARSLMDYWEYAFGSLLASSLTLLSSTYTGGLIAGDNPYITPIYPWGSNPISNHFLGSDNFTIHTDAAEFTRLGKVNLLKDWPECLRNLRVCWEGPKTGVNCGVCEKCVRTQLEFLVNGMDPSQCFVKPLSPGDVLKVSPRNVVQLELMQEMVVACNANNTSSWWANELQTIVKRGVLKVKKQPVAKYRGKLGIRAKLREVAAKRNSPAL